MLLAITVVSLALDLEVDVLGRRWHRKDQDHG
jgi:hypothetical protein